MHLPELLMLPAPYFECFLRAHLFPFTFLFTLSSGFLWFCALWAVAALYLGCAAACMLTWGLLTCARDQLLKAAVVLRLMQRLYWLLRLLRLVLVYR